MKSTPQKSFDELVEDSIEEVFNFLSNLEYGFVRSRGKWLMEEGELDTLEKILRNSFKKLKKKL